LVVSVQAWSILRIARNRFLCRQLDAGRFDARSAVPARAALRALWPAVWRSFLGIVAIVGLNYAGAIFYAQIGDVTSVASYLLAIRLLNAIGALSRAPFYARIPTLVRLHAQGERGQQILTARTG